LEAQRINTAYRYLLKAAGNTLAPGDNLKIRRAVDLACKAYGNNLTLTGEPEILHALSVATIVAGELGLGLTSIITALLHDTYERLDISQQDLEKEFGKKVVEILQGFSRITGIDSMQSSYQAENFRKLLLSLADDVRVILIKLVERFENMRKLDNARRKKNCRLHLRPISLRTLAHRLGL
jgi:GTP pyrophosphokinase